MTVHSVPSERRRRGGVCGTLRAPRPVHNTVPKGRQPLPPLAVMIRSRLVPSPARRFLFGSLLDAFCNASAGQSGLQLAFGLCRPNGLLAPICVSKTLRRQCRAAVFAHRPGGRRGHGLVGRPQARHGSVQHQYRRHRPGSERANRDKSAGWLLSSRPRPLGRRLRRGVLRAGPDAGLRRAPARAEAAPRRHHGRAS